MGGLEAAAQAVAQRIPGDRSRQDAQWRGERVPGWLGEDKEKHINTAPYYLRFSISGKRLNGEAINFGALKILTMFCDSRLLERGRRFCYCFFLEIYIFFFKKAGGELNGYWKGNS